MRKKTRNQAVHTAACAAPPKDTPWRNRRRRGISITIIVVEVMRWKNGTIDWHDPLDTSMAVTVVLSSFQMVCNTARLIARELARLLPDRVVFERPTDKARFAFGW
ncbi:hypothetical protein ACFXJO_21140 [Streptomyces lavendulae]|uniref:hypothetical protein n=1 Tax=Streptomyces lavendulae TaxID=1914 RepID=UPI00367B8972